MDFEVALLRGPVVAVGAFIGARSRVASHMLREGAKEWEAASTDVAVVSLWDFVILTFKLLFNIGFFANQLFLGLHDLYALSWIHVIG